MTIAEIAKLANVSPAAVSRYLNGGYISGEKSAAIKKVIERTGYIPSSSAQTMRTGKSNLIGVIVPKLSSESISSMVDGITEALSGTPYNIILANTSNSVDKELEFLKIFQNNMVDAVILTGTIMLKKHHEIMLAYKDKPIVVLGQLDSKYSCVYYDDYNAAYNITEHLISRGCKKIAMIYVNPKDKAAGKARIDGWRDALKANGLPHDDEFTAESSFSIGGGYGAAEKLLGSGVRFDGLFCATDTTAFGAKHKLIEAGIKIPDDMKLASIGGSKMSAVVEPPLTTVNMHYTEAGKEAAMIILDRLKNGSRIIKQHKLSSDIITRKSSELY